MSRNGIPLYNMSENRPVVAFAAVKELQTSAQQRVKELENPALNYYLDPVVRIELLAEARSTLQKATALRNMLQAKVDAGNVVLP